MTFKLGDLVRIWFADKEGFNDIGIFLRENKKYYRTIEILYKNKIYHFNPIFIKSL